MPRPLSVTSFFDTVRLLAVVLKSEIPNKIDTLSDLLDRYEQLRPEQLDRISPKMFDTIAAAYNVVLRRDPLFDDSLDDTQYLELTEAVA